MLCAAMSIPVFAEELSSINDDEIISEYENASDVYSTLSVSSATARCRSYCVGYNNVTQISVTQTLQKFWGLWIWNDVDSASWTDSSMSNGIDASHSKHGLSSGTYRLKSEFTLRTQNGQTETITIYSSEKSVS
jgi:hypothetical protein